MPSVQDNQPKLTHRQQQLIAELLKPENKSVRAAALAVDMHAQTAHRMLKRADVDAAFTLAKQEASDKQSGMVETFGRLSSRLARKLDNLGVEDLKDPIVAGQFLKLFLDCKKIALDLEEREGISDELPQENYDRWRSRIERTWEVAVRWGIRIGRRMSRPQDVVVPSSPPLASEPD